MLSDDLGDRLYRARMRELGRKSGAIARLRLETDPDYFRNLGSRGGQASAAATRRRLAESAEVAVELSEGARRPTVAAVEDEREPTPFATLLPAETPLSKSLVVDFLDAIIARGR